MSNQRDTGTGKQVDLYRPIAAEVAAIQIDTTDLDGAAETTATIQ